MSSVHHPQLKKKLAYERDHYNRNGENNKAWRRAKPLKKAKARRAFRKAGRDLLGVCLDESAGTPVAALRKLGSLRQRKVLDWGPMYLREFVATRRVRNARRNLAVKARPEDPHPGT